MKWSIHLSDGSCVGYVFAQDEEEARLVALYHYGDKQLRNKDFSVFQR